MTINTLPKNDVISLKTIILNQVATYDLAFKEKTITLTLANKEKVILPKNTNIGNIRDLINRN